MGLTKWQALPHNSGYKLGWVEASVVGMVLYNFEKLTFFNGRRSGFNVAVQNKYTQVGAGRKVAYYISLIYWAIALSAGIFWTYETVLMATTKLINPPISTRTRLISNETLTYPAVTLCYKNEDGRYFNDTWLDFAWGEMSLTELWNKTTYKAKIVELHNLYNFTHNEQGHHMSIVASLNKDAKALENSVNYFYEHGRCYTFKPKQPNIGLPPGSLYGYKFWLNYKYRPIQFSNYSNSQEIVKRRREEGRFMGGWDVFIHDPKTAWSENEPLTNSHHEHFFLESGTKVQIKIGMSTYSTLNTSGDPCGSDSITLCKESCRWGHLMRNIGINCSLPFTYPKQLGPLNIQQCNSFNQTMSMMYHYRDWFRFTPECTKICLRNCEGVMFSGQLLRKEILKISQKDSAFLEIYFPSGMYLKLEEEVAYGLSMFLADMGGVYGFALGISVITFLEFMDWILLKICRCFTENVRCCRGNKVFPGEGKYVKYVSLTDSVDNTEEVD